MVLMWYGGSRVVLWFLVVRWFLFLNFPWLAWFFVFKYFLFFCLCQWVSVWEGCGSKHWLLLDLVYSLVVLLLRLT